MGLFTYCLALVGVVLSVYVDLLFFVFYVLITCCCLFGFWDACVITCSWVVLFCLLLVLLVLLLVVFTCFVYLLVLFVLFCFWRVFLWFSSFG